MSTWPERATLAATYPFAFWVAGVASHAYQLAGRWTTSPASPVSSSDLADIGKHAAEGDEEEQRARFFKPISHAHNALLVVFLAGGLIPGLYALGGWLFAHGNTDPLPDFIDGVSAVFCSAPFALAPYILGDACNLVNTSLGRSFASRTLHFESRSPYATRALSALGLAAVPAFAFLPAPLNLPFLALVVYFWVMMMSAWGVGIVGEGVQVKWLLLVPVMIEACLLAFFLVVVGVIMLVAGKPEDVEREPGPDHDAVFRCLFLFSAGVGVGCFSWIMSALYRLDRYLESQKVPSDALLGDAEACADADLHAPPLLLPLLDPPTGVRARVPRLPALLAGRLRARGADARLRTLSYARAATAAFVLVDLALPTVLRALNGPPAAPSDVLQSHIFSAGAAPVFVLTAVWGLARWRGEVDVVFAHRDEDA